MHNVIQLVRVLPEDVFIEPTPSSPALASAQQSTDSLTSDSIATSAETSEGGARFNNIVRELVETERKYVQDLEVMQVRHNTLLLWPPCSSAMQKYSQAATQMNALDRETIHLLFPGLKDLLNFQRKFLIKLESMAEQPWGDQSWGLPFRENVRPQILDLDFGIPYTEVPLSIIRLVIANPERNNRKKPSLRHIEPTVPIIRRRRTSYYKRCKT